MSFQDNHRFKLITDDGGKLNEKIFGYQGDCNDGKKQNERFERYYWERERFLKAFS